VFRMRYQGNMLRMRFARRDQVFTGWHHYRKLQFRRIRGSLLTQRWLHTDPSRMN
jgi:hypothetical protein